MNDFGGRQLGNGRYNVKKRASAARVSPLRAQTKKRYYVLRVVIELARVALGDRRARSPQLYLYEKVKLSIT
jgi:hypothetical protein